MNEIGKLNGIQPIGQEAFQQVLRRNSMGADFETLLRKQLEENSALQFSRHALERAQQRDISLTQDLLQNLDQAVERAREKGAKDVVVFDAKNAFIVNIPNNMVVTAMSGDEMKDKIFTNIDSAVIL